MEGDSVDTLTPGDYIITYNASADAAGNTPDEQSITVSVLSPSITINDVTLSEGSPGITNFEFTVTRSSNSATLSVDYSTNDDTAIAPTDYLSIPIDTLNFVCWWITNSNNCGICKW